MLKKNLYGFIISLQLVQESSAKQGSVPDPSQDIQQQLTKAQEELNKSKEELSTVKEEMQKKQDEVCSPVHLVHRAHLGFREVCTDAKKILIWIT